jgi:hypothetical protein
MLLMKLMILREPIWPLLAAATKFADFLDRKVVGSRPDNKI